MSKKRKKPVKPARRKPAPKPKLKRKAPLPRRRRKRDGSGRLRDYKEEYRRRKVLGLEDVVARDARRVFGRRPKRQKGDDDASQYELRLAELAERDGRFDWLDEASFIAEMRAKGATEREAYTLWFSP